MNDRKTWRCEFCGQIVQWNNGKPMLPTGYYTNCKLRNHMIGDECVAYRDPVTARQLLKAREK